MWQNFRCVRILCNADILRYLSRLVTSSQDTETRDQLELEKILRCKLLNEVCEDLCASVPYFTCMPTNTTQDSMSELRLKASNIVSEGTSILWPLYIIADCQWASVDKRMFAVTQMRKIGELSANQQAGVLATRLQNGPVDSVMEDRVADGLKHRMHEHDDFFPPR
jgi:hypothetical protein